jgi:hypothetical protein
MENIREFIDFICPEHSRTSCSDDDISNGFYLEEDRETISKERYHRCVRCALLEIENGTIKRTEANNRIIPERLSL